MAQKESHRPRWRQVQVVHGDPYHVEGRTLLPVARIVSLGGARGTVGQDRIAGRSTAWVRVSPVAVLDQHGGTERAVAVYDAAALAIRGNLAAALAILLFFAVVRWLAGRRHQRAVRNGNGEGARRPDSQTQSSAGATE